MRGVAGLVTCGDADIARYPKFLRKKYFYDFLGFFRVFFAASPYFWSQGSPKRPKTAENPM
jgi:hypothetical protein